MDSWDIIRTIIPLLAMFGSALAVFWMAVSRLASYGERLDQIERRLSGIETKIASVPILEQRIHTGEGETEHAREVMDRIMTDLAEIRREMAVLSERLKTHSRP